MVSFRAALVALMVAGSAVAAGAGGPDANAVIDGWIAVQARATNWQASFIQTRNLPALRQPLSATGRVWYASPGTFRWEILAPAPVIALRNAAGMTVYYPRLNRAERYPLDGAAGPMKDAMAIFDAGFPRDRREFRQRFRVVSLVETNSQWQLAMAPAASATRRFVSRITLNLATNDYSLAGDEITFGDGSRMANAYSEARINQTLDAAVFALQFPTNTVFTEPLRR